LRAPGELAGGEGGADQGQAEPVGAGVDSGGPAVGGVVGGDKERELGERGVDVGGERGELAAAGDGGGHVEAGRAGAVVVLGGRLGHGSSLPSIRSKGNALHRGYAREIRLVERVPLTPVGKIDRKRLRTLLTD